MDDGDHVVTVRGGHIVNLSTVELRELRDLAIGWVGAPEHLMAVVNAAIGWRRHPDPSHADRLVAVVDDLLDRRLAWE